MKEAALAFLDGAHIPYEVTAHEAVYTMEDMQKAGLDRLGTLCKNLFLRDAKGKRYFLVTADNDTPVDLKALGETLEAGRLSFASAERLQRVLGVTAGCVSPLGVLNDTEHLVTVVLDETLRGNPRLGVHPNEHTATVWLSFADLVKALEAADATVVVKRLGSR